MTLSVYYARTRDLRKGEVILCDSCKWNLSSDLELVWISYTAINAECKFCKFEATKRTTMVDRIKVLLS